MRISLVAFLSLLPALALAPAAHADPATSDGGAARYDEALVTLRLVEARRAANDDAPERRAAAAANLANSVVDAPQLRALTLDPDASVRHAALAALGTAPCTPANVKLLTEVLKSADAAAAATALGHCGDRGAVAFLREALMYGRAPVEVATAMSRLGDETAARRIATGLRRMGGAYGAAGELALSALDGRKTAQR